MNFLVLSSRNTFALDIIRKLGSAGHTVIAADTYDGAIGNHSRFVHAHAATASPRYDTDQYIADINELIRKYDIDVIIPTFEEVFYLAARAHDLDPRAKLFAGSFDKLARLHDKASFKRLVIEAGVPVPETVVAQSHEELLAAIDRFPRFFARAAFSRGGVGLLTNTGPLAGKMAIEDCHPTPDQPWLVQPFVDGPMVCTYSIVVDGAVVAHSTYRAPEQWANSTGISFETVDSTDTLRYTQQIVDALDPNYTGQLSFDFVDNDGEYFAIECNPRPTNGVIMLDTEVVAHGLAGTPGALVVAPAGETRQISLAVLADAFTDKLKHLKKSLHDFLTVKDVGAGWHDSLAMMWSPATLIHGAKLSAGERHEILGALAEDIVWNGEPIVGMTDTDAEQLEAIHLQRV